jgi:carboxymethylenebutenolidase
MSRRDVSIPSPDGEFRAFVFTPDHGQGPWPTALMFMDGLAIRPALFEMAERLASHGYYVLLPDMFWRVGAYPPLNPKEVLADPEKRKAFMTTYFGSTNPEKSTRDTKACLDWLDRQPQAKADKIGVFGYCMGGPLSLRAAGRFPDRIAAVGAFHGGNMATDDPESPHLLADKVKARVLVAGADKDASFDEAQKARLETALKAAKVDATVVIYPDALHGYAPADMPTFNPEACERHWRELIALFDGVLK